MRLQASVIILKPLEAYSTSVFTWNQFELNRFQFGRAEPVPETVETGFSVQCRQALR